MKALVLEEYGKLVYRDVPEPVAAAGEVLVEVKACGICGSDIHGMDGSSGRRVPPLIMGHEASGVIADVGSGVDGWVTGERVTFDSTVYCGDCHFCRRGQINLCDSRRVLGVACEEFRQEGAFAEYVAVPAHILYRIPEAVSFEHAAMVEPASVAVHAVNRTPVQLNDAAVVIGAGVIGLLVVQALRAAGCGRIIAVDLSPTRLELACDLGADEGLGPDETDIVEAIREMTGGRGADIAIEAVGVEQTVCAAVSCVRKGGAVTLVGNLSPHVEFLLQAAVTRELSLYGSAASCGEYPDCLDLMARGCVRVNPMISAVAPLSEGAQWFERLRAGEDGVVKVILTPP
jgi:L-iditol 2-dehydrogenase